MTVSTELLLILVAAAFYLLDSALLLYVNEAVFVPTWRGWTVRFGSDRARLAGRELYLPNPLTPHRPIFRLSWSFEDAGARNISAEWTQLSNQLRVLAGSVWAVFLGIFVFLPFALFTQIGRPLVPAVLIWIYMCIAITMGWAYFSRARINLNSRRFRGLALEALACPPCAINFIRKVALNQSVQEDLTAASERLLTPDARVAVQRECLARLEEQIDGEEESSPRAAALRVHRERLQSRPS